MKIRRIGIVAPSCPIDADIAEQVQARAAALFGDAAPKLIFHPQCFIQHGHFAGEDHVRLQALVETANDPDIDAVWFARGGYGSCRIAEAALPQLNDMARQKFWLGYSDGGTLLAGLYTHGFTDIAHGPMASDIRRVDGDVAIDRALAWLVNKDIAAVEPHHDGYPRAAFNMTILSHVIGTPLQPDLTDHVLMLEDISEHHYRIDRTLCHITSNPNIRRIAGLRIGRISDVIPNDRPFGYDIAEIVAHWCEVSGIRLLGEADIGHDIGNKVVVFGNSL